MKKAFIYVGHSNWGKSFALKQVTGGNKDKKIVKINNLLVWVRKMSNDDTATGLLNFVRTISNNRYKNFILAYCPKHDTDQRAMETLNILRQSCELYFFVQEEKYNNPATRITEQEILHLQEIGEVEILQGQLPDTVRASKFTDFIKQYI